jgi:hypothetical protein
MLTQDKHIKTFKIISFKKSGKLSNDFSLEIPVRIDKDLHHVYMQDATDWVKKELSKEYIYMIDHDDGFPCLILN